MINDETKRKLREMNLGEVISDLRKINEMLIRFTYLYGGAFAK